MAFLSLCKAADCCMLTLVTATQQLAASTETYGEHPTVTPLRILRVARGLSQEELARRAGVNRSTVSRLEQGQEEPLRATQTVLADALGYPVALIFPQNDLDPEASRAESQKLASGVATVEG